MRIVAILITFALLLAGCADDGRPATDAWRTEWDAVTGSMPTLADLGSPPDQDLCSETLGRLREAPDDLLPSPTAATDGPVREWLRVAEGAMFECPPTGSSGSMESAYEDLAAFEAEVEASLGG